MPLDLTGISNRNEYFSSHYLAALIEGDLKDTLARWKETAEANPDSEAHRSPERRIATLYKPYFNLLNRYVVLRDPAERLAAQREFLPRLLDALGYVYQPSWRSIGPSGTPLAKCLRLPMLGEVTKSSGAPWLWIVEALPPADEPETDPLSLPVHSAQFDGDPAHHDPQLASPHPARDLAWDELVTRHIFSLDEAPRWIFLLSLGHVVLLDRTKWPEKRHLSFDCERRYGKPMKWAT
ncbi:MAG: hypothetical protein NTW21_18660 [Verrucomicrobia bacterium]|nr:hypothetical protein [Verrucomicrobiota bacterium]